MTDTKKAAPSKESDPKNLPFNNSKTNKNNHPNNKTQSANKSCTFYTAYTNADLPYTDEGESCTIPNPSTPDEEQLPPSQRETADLVIEKIRGLIAYHPESAEWFKRDGDIWIECDADTVNPYIIKALDKVKNKKYSYSVVSSIKNFVKDLLRIYQFESSRHLLPLNNGVYNLKTNQLENYSQYRYNWQLPYNYEPDAKCPSILRYFLTATDRDKELIKFLLAWMRILISGEYTVQKYIELVGDGGTGKSTFLELCTFVVGEVNRVVTDLKSLEENRFESANLQNKRLALITDSTRYGGEVAQLKALTGGDAVRNEKKNKQAGNSFVFKGLVMIAANEPIQSGDYTSGLARRRIPIIFNARVSEKEKSRYKFGVIQQMKSELSGLLNILLNIDIQDAVKTIKYPEGTLKKIQLQSELNANPILQWMNERLIFCAKGRESYIGSGHKKTDSIEVMQDAEQSKLYPNYIAWCDENGRKPVAIQRFSGLVEDMARSHDIETEKHRKNAGNIFTGLRLRTGSEIQPLLLDSVEANTKSVEGKLKSVEANRASVGGVGGVELNQVIDSQPMAVRL